MGLNVRSNSWLNGNSSLSWVFVIERLGISFEQLGHTFYPISTNGYDKSIFTEDKIYKSILELDRLKKQNIPIDLDICYTVPSNFGSRFLANSKHKAAIYNYETHNPHGNNGWDPQWKKYYHLVDFYFPSSNFSAEIFYKNGIPKEKIFVIPHGIDTEVFNTKTPPIKLKTQKSFKFCSIVAPHFRKNIDTLLHAYCQAFTNKDDVCLVLKTKVYKHSDGMYDAKKNPKGRKPFEIVLGDVFKELVARYGKNMPEIELLSGHVENVSGIYNACNVHVSTTGSEGFYLPGLESMGSNLINIMPNYSGHLDYANTSNSLLIDTKLREAKNVEQYWAYNKGSLIGQPDIKHTAELMQKAYKEYDVLLEKFKPEMEKTTKQFSWINAAQKIIDVCDGKIEHYIPGTYNLNGHKRLK